MFPYIGMFSLEAGRGRPIPVDFILSDSRDEVIRKRDSLALTSTTLLADRPAKSKPVHLNILIKGSSSLTVTLPFTDLSHTFMQPFEPKALLPPYI